MEKSFYGALFTYLLLLERGNRTIQLADPICLSLSKVYGKSFIARLGSFIARLGSIQTNSKRKKFPHSSIAVPSSEGQCSASFLTRAVPAPGYATVSILQTPF